MAKSDKSRDDQWVNDRMSALEPAGWQPSGANRLSEFRARRASRRGPRRRWVAAVVGAAAIGSLLPVTRTFAARCVDACVGVTARVGQLFQPGQAQNPSSGLMPEARRAAAPDFVLDDGRGGRLQLSALGGQVVLVNFWATWCAPCKVEIPWFAEFQGRYRDRGLTVIGISLDDDGWTSVRQFATEAEVNYGLAIVTEEVSKAYGGLGALPATFLVDRRGRVAAKHVGIVSKAQYEDEVVRLLSEK